jgi:hypothetical protein
MKLRCTGIWEKKGGVAIVISALQALRFTRNLKKIKIGILVTLLFSGHRMKNHRSMKDYEAELQQPREDAVAL